MQQLSLLFSLFFFLKNCSFSLCRYENSAIAQLKKARPRPPRHCQSVCHPVTYTCQSAGARISISDVLKAQEPELGTGQSFTRSNAGQSRREVLLVRSPGDWRPQNGPSFGPRCRGAISLSPTRRRSASWARPARGRPEVSDPLRARNLGGGIFRVCWLVAPSADRRRLLTGTSRSR